MLNVCHMTKLKTRMLVYLLLKTSFNYLAFQYFDYMCRLSLSLAFCVLFCRSLFFVLLYFFFWPLCCLFFCLLAIVLSVLLSFGHCVVCSSSIYGFWLPHWFLQTFLTRNAQCALNSISSFWYQSLHIAGVDPYITSLLTSNELMDLHVVISKFVITFWCECYHLL